MMGGALWAVLKGDELTRGDEDVVDSYWLGEPTYQGGLRLTAQKPHGKNYTVRRRCKDLCQNQRVAT